MSAPSPRCPICEAASAAFTVKGGHALYRCGGCALIFLHPIPEPGELARLYREEWTKRNRSCHRPDQGFAPRRRFLRGLRWGRKARHLRRLCGGDRLLEIGCGAGDYLAAAAKAGFADILASEPSVQEAEHARARGFDVRANLFEEIDFGERRFDAIVARQVIEHVANPVQVLAKARDLLAPGGHIWLETPCSTHRRAVRWGLRWYSLCPPWHIHVFDEKSMALLFERAGLTPVDIHRHFWRPDATGIARV